MVRSSFRGSSPKRSMKPSFVMSMSSCGGRRHVKMQCAHTRLSVHFGCALLTGASLLQFIVACTGGYDSAARMIQLHSCVPTSSAETSRREGTPAKHKRGLHDLLLQIAHARVHAACACWQRCSAYLTCSTR